MTTPPPPPAPSAGQPPQNYLVWAIITTVLCCLPLGIASIVFSTQVNSKWSMGDVAGAMDASSKAKNFALWGTILGAVGAIAYGIFWAVVIANGTVTTY